MLSLQRLRKKLEIQRERERERERERGCLVKRSPEEPGHESRRDERTRGGAERDVSNDSKLAAGWARGNHGALRIGVP